MSWRIGASWWAIVPVVAVAALGPGGARVLSADPPPRPRTAVDAWVPYWTVDTAGPDLPLHDGQLRQVSPFWFEATSAGTIVVDPHVGTTPVDGFVDAARGVGAAIVPTITDGTAPLEMASILADPVDRTVHVDAIVAFALDGAPDGPVRRRVRRGDCR